MLGRFFKPQHQVVSDPPWAHYLLGHTEWAWVWLVPRLWLGWEWLQAGLHKVTDPKWMDTGEALRGFWARVIVVPEQGRPLITYDWYRDFIRFLYDGGHQTWFAKLVALGELGVGIALLLGVLVGIAAFSGAFMNLNFMLAGTASTNPILFMVAVALILGWKVAGWWGVDRWLLPILGTPWQPGRVFRPVEDGESNGGSPSPGRR